MDIPPLLWRLLKCNALPVPFAKTGFFCTIVDDSWSSWTLLDALGHSNWNPRRFGEVSGSFLDCFRGQISRSTKHCNIKFIILYIYKVIYIVYLYTFIKLHFWALLRGLLSLARLADPAAPHWSGWAMLQSSSSLWTLLHLFGGSSSPHRCAWAMLQSSWILWTLLPLLGGSSSPHRSACAMLRSSWIILYLSHIDFYMNCIFFIFSLHWIHVLLSLYIRFCNF